MNNFSRLLCDAAVLLCFCVSLRGHLYLVRQVARDLYTNFFCLEIFDKLTI